MLRLVFKLPLRQAEGFWRPILSLMDIDLDAPDPTTLSRRSQGLNVQLDRVAGDNSIHLIVDSTGLSMVGEGEWAAAKYGGRGRRGWKKLHLGVDRTGVIVAPTLTHGSADDARVGVDLIDGIEDDMGFYPFSTDSLIKAMDCMSSDHFGQKSVLSKRRFSVSA
jgi:hypothetical protein